MEGLPEKLFDPSVLGERPTGVARLIATISPEQVAGYDPSNLGRIDRIKSLAAAREMWRDALVNSYPVPAEDELHFKTNWAGNCAGGYSLGNLCVNVEKCDSAKSSKNFEKFCSRLGGKYSCGCNFDYEVDTIGTDKGMDDGAIEAEVVD